MFGTGRESDSVTPCASFRGCAHRDLNVYGCAISGSLPASLATLTALTQLQFAYNSMATTIPAFLSQLTSLMYVPSALCPRWPLFPIRV